MKAALAAVTGLLALGCALAARSVQVPAGSLWPEAAAWVPHPDSIARRWREVAACGGVPEMPLPAVRWYLVHSNQFGHPDAEERRRGSVLLGATFLNEPGGPTIYLNAAMLGSRLLWAVVHHELVHLLPDDRRESHPRRLFPRCEGT